jgi:hypothetical protein
MLIPINGRAYLLRQILNLLARLEKQKTRVGSGLWNGHPASVARANNANSVIDQSTL